MNAGAVEQAPQALPAAAEATLPDSPPKQLPLDFAKRKVSDTQGHKLFSQLSSMTSRSPYRLEDPQQGRGDERVLDFEDQERIRSPASTEAYMNAGLSDYLPRDDSSGSSDAPPPSPSLISPRTKFAFGDIDYQSSYSSKVRHYEPARVVLHRTELQKPRDDGPKPPSPPANVILPNSLLSTLGSSPDNDVPLRQIRELKQPIYVPAVLRQTDNNAWGVHKGRAALLAGAGQTSTKHWISDARAAQCAACHRPFRWYRRRHHCRRCGQVFCAQDVQHQVGLDRMLNFSVLGHPAKACKSCADAFRVFRMETAPAATSPTAAQTPAAAPVEELEPANAVSQWSTF